MQYRQAEYNLPVDAKCLLFYWVTYRSDAQALYHKSLTACDCWLSKRVPSVTFPGICVFISIRTIYICRLGVTTY
jgi:hypothetical protein